MTAEQELPLLYAQNWEDARLELEALVIERSDVVLAIGGGGCTALSLLACAPRSLCVVDSNAAQLHVVALKLAAVQALSSDEALAFLDPASELDRRVLWPAVRAKLDARAQSYWDAHSDSIARGILGEGRAERFLARFATAFGVVVCSRRKTRALLTARDPHVRARRLEGLSKRLRYRAIFRLLDKRLIERALGGAFYTNVNADDFGPKLRERFERSVLDPSAPENYFLSRILLGEMPASAEGRPLYLTTGGGRAVRTSAERLTLSHSSVLAHLRAQPSESIDKVYLSNVAEWLDDAGREMLFTELARVVRGGGRVAFRALFAERPLPASVRGSFVIDEALSNRLEREDRAFINASFRVAHIERGHAHG